MRRFAPAVLLLAVACAAGPAAPEALDPRNDACAWCRMLVSDVRFAAQVAAPGEEPKFFDDIGCLRDYLRAAPVRPRGAVAFVVDHRSGAWVRAARATYTRVPDLETPMGFHLIAHADQASRDADGYARGGAPVAPPEIFGPEGPPDA